MSLAKFLLVVALASLLTAAAQNRSPKPIPKQSPTPLPNKAPSVKLVPATGRVTLPGCDDAAPPTPGCPSTSPKVKLSARATDPDGDTMLYTYSTTGGRIEGDGPEVTLDLTGIAPGVYSVTLEVDDGNGGTANDSAKVEVARCTCDPPPMIGDCPWVVLHCPDTVASKQPVTFTADINGGDPAVTPTFNWTVSAGEITRGQGTGSIMVDTSNAVGQSVTATVKVGGYESACTMEESCTVRLVAPPVSRKVDEYGDIKLKDERARLDKFAEELLTDSTAQGFFVCYGGRRSTAGEAQRRCDRAMKYTSRHPWTANARLVTVDAGYRCEPSVELWLVPSGAEPPADAPLTVPEPKPSAAKCRP